MKSIDKPSQMKPTREAPRLMKISRRVQPRPNKWWVRSLMWPCRSNNGSVSHQTLSFKRQILKTWWDQIQTVTLNMSKNSINNRCIDKLITKILKSYKLRKIRVEPRSRCNRKLQIQRRDLVYWSNSQKARLERVSYKTTTLSQVCLTAQTMGTICARFPTIRKLEKVPRNCICPLSSQKAKRRRP